MKFSPSLRQITDRMNWNMIKRYTFLTIGVSATGLGMVGVFIPLLPTVPFALLALYCFSVSSPRFQAWLLANRLLGPTLRNIKENRGLSIKEKVRIVTASITRQAKSISDINNTRVIFRRNDPTQRLVKQAYPTIRASPNSQRRFLISVCSSMKGKG